MILKLASRDRSVLDDLLNIAQHDLSARSSSVERSVKRSLKRIANKAKTRSDRLERLTSSTGFMGILVYLALKEVLEEKVQ